MLNILNSKRGFAHLGLILLLFAIGIGVYLVSQKTNLKPKAAGETIQFVDNNGNPITATTSASVKIKFTPANEINGLKNLDPENANRSNRSKPPSSESPNGWVYISGKLLDRLNPSRGVNGYIEYCDPAKKGALTKITTSYDGFFSFSIQKGKEFCIKASSVSGYLVPSAVNARSQDKLSYESQIAGLDCSKDKSRKCKPLIVKSLDLAIDTQFDFAYSQIPTPTTFPTPFPSHSATPIPTVKPSVSPSPNTPVPIGVSLAEDPNYTVNYRGYSPNIAGMIIEYTFTNPNPGKKLIYAEYIYSDGTIINAIPFPLSIDLQPLATPTPAPTPSISPSPSPSPLPLCNFQTEVCFDKSEANVTVEEGHGFQGPNYWSSPAFNLVGQGARGFNLFSDGINLVSISPSGGAFANGTALQINAQIPNGASYGNYNRIIKMSAPDSEGRYIETPYILKLNITYQASTSPIAWSEPTKITLTKKINDFSGYPIIKFNYTSNTILRVEPTPDISGQSYFYAIFTSNFTNRAVFKIGSVDLQTGFSGPNNVVPGVYTGNFVFYDDNQGRKEIFRIPYEITLTN